MNRAKGGDWEVPVNCEFCNKVSPPLASHHLIPRWLNQKDEDTIELCQSCHKRFDTYVDNFIKYGSFKTEKWWNPKKIRRQSRNYARQYIRTKRLFYLTPVSYINYEDYLYVNIKTGHIGITHSWRNRGLKG